MPQVEELQPTGVAEQVTNGQDPNCPRLGENNNSRTPVRHGNTKPRATIVLLFGIVHVAGAVEGAARKTEQEVQQDQNAGKKEDKKEKKTEVAKKKIVN